MWESLLSLDFKKELLVTVYIYKEITASKINLNYIILHICSMPKLFSTSLFIILIVGFNSELFSQVKKPSNISVTTYTLVSEKEYQPLWLSANKGGIFEEFSDVNSVQRIRLNNSLQSEKTLDYSYGVDIVSLGANSSSEVYLNQLYVTGKAYLFQVDIGRKMRTVGENPESLTSGSMVLGNNAIPIPMINISIPEFTPVPITYGLLHFRGNLAHGWLEDDRYVKGAYLHEKSFYLQGGRDNWPVKAYAGLVHFVQWGGTSSNPNVGKLPSGFDDYISVFLGEGGGENAPDGEQINALGNHLGIWDSGIKAESKSYTYQVFWQHYFEGGSGLTHQNIGDGLWGVNIQKKEKSIISGLQWELIYTKHQSGPGEPDRPGNTPHCEEENCGFKYGGRDNYYNNYIYRSGWTYNGRNLGNPLLMNVAQYQHYKPGANTYNAAIESNRIVAHHVGLEGYFADDLRYKAFITYVRHYGNYQGLAGGEPYDNNNPPDGLEEYEFYPPLHQWSFMFEAAYSFEQLPNLDFKTTLAYDTGDLTNNAGVMIGATWNFR